MKIFLGFLFVCFYAGWLLNRFSMRTMSILLVGFSLFICFGYFFLNWI
ncbi:hypothetical protein [Candidatus Oscillochloris fontis]|nr:hypothetical protein [Candidatus Oscillochloris fontis]